jgi:hypothetical protein
LFDPINGSMKKRYLIIVFSILCFSLIGTSDVPFFSSAGWAELDSKNPPPESFPDSESTSMSCMSWLERIDTHWGGRFKTTGIASQVTDDTIFAPVGTATYYDGSTNFRLINETFFTESLFFEIDYEIIGAAGDSIRKQEELKELFPNIPDNVFFLGTPLEDDRRLMDLTGVISEGDGYFLIQRLDRLYLALNQHWGSVRIGRQAITWGNGFVFNPMDLFNPFPPTAIDRDYKVGDDMVNAQVSIPGIGNLQGLYVVRRDPDSDAVASDEASLAGKLHFAAGTTEFDVMVAKNYSDYVVGMGTTGYLGDTAWRLDGTWTFLDDSDDYLSIVANMDYSWGWFGKNFYGFIEYYFNGLGKNNYPDALLDPDITERLARGELFVLGRNYLSGHIQVELHPLFKIFFTAINNIEDPSGILQPYATWDITQNLQLTAGVNVYYGAKGTEFGGFILPGTDIYSKSPNNAYLWLIYYF